MSKIFRSLPRFLFCALAGGAFSAGAQDVPAEGSLFPSTMPEQPYDASTVIPQPGEKLTAMGRRASSARWGPLGFQPINYGFSYGDGLQGQPGDDEKSIIHTISAGLTLHLGDRWTLDYSPAMTIYSSSQLEDNASHSVSLNGSAEYNDWTFGFSQSYSSALGLLVETGTQTDTETHSTALSASHHFNSALWTELGLNQNLSFADGFTDSMEWSTLDWLNYQFNPGCFAGVGVGFGYVDVSTGFDNAYGQLKGQVGWRVSDKTSLHLNAGAEARQFLDSGGDTVINPLFGASITYRPFQFTGITLSANRSVSTSYFENQITESTGVQISLSQRLLEKLNLNLGYGYSTTEYVSGVESVSLDRKDSGTFFSIGLNCPIRTHLTVGIFYTQSENSSDESGFGFTSRQIGFNLAYSF